MNKVEVYSNWCYRDMLDGKLLENGELLKVKWPDGSITKEKVIVESSSYTMMDHASPWEVITTKAYVQTESKGVKNLVRLYGQDILCERITLVAKEKKPVATKRRKKKV